MNRVIIYNSEQEAKDRTVAEATARGCSGTTTEWWGKKEGTDGKWALFIGEDTVSETVTEIEDDWIKEI